MGKKPRRTRSVKSPKVKGNLSAKRVERAVRVVAERSSASRSATKSNSVRRKQAAGSR